MNTVKNMTTRQILPYRTSETEKAPAGGPEMLIADCLSVNEVGHLTIGGADTVTLAQQYGTPLYCMSEDEIRKSCRSFTHAMHTYYGADSLVAYASKALNCKEMCRIAMQEGLGLDVVSGGELYTAMSVGFPAERIFFHGNNKTPAELEYALSCKVGYVVVDNIFELELLNALARTNNLTQRILLRVKPGVEVHTHAFVVTGAIDSKFGFALENGEAIKAVEKAKDYGHLSYEGLHCHIGSQIFEVEPFCETARIMLRFIKEIKDRFAMPTRMLNLGGGMGVKYTPENEPSAPAEFIRQVADVVDAQCAAMELERPIMVIEPGRAIVAPAGITLYTVGGIKEIKGVRTYVSVDGGMPDNPRYALYGSEYTIVVANRAAKPADWYVTIAGKCCESGDLLQENTGIQHAEVGDILAVLSTGAYNYSMASNYNRIPRPAMIMIKDGNPRVIIERETYADLVAKDR